MSDEELDGNLWHFYVEAITATGIKYSELSLLSFRNVFEWYLIEKGRTVLKERQ